jgi:hypothetical protein
MAVGDLTSAAKIKAWRSPPLTTDADDGRIARVITAASVFLLNELQRALVSTAYQDVVDGDGSHSLVLDQWPVTSVTSLVVDGVTTIPAATSADRSNAAYSGYLLYPKTGKLELRGFRFSRGRQNVAVSYTAGFLVSGEAKTVPAQPFQLAVSALAQPFAGDAGVTYANGTALAAVAASPAQGQYVAPADPGGSYQFNAADAAAGILLSYSFTPPDIEQACIELVILRLNESGRIGEQSKVLAGENVTYFTRAALTDSIMECLSNYRRVVI